MGMSKGKDIKLLQYNKEDIVFSLVLHGDNTITMIKEDGTTTQITFENSDLGEIRAKVELKREIINHLKGLEEITNSGASHVYINKKNLQNSNTVRLLTENISTTNSTYRGIILDMRPNGEIVLELAPGGGNQTFTKETIAILMDEAIDNMISWDIVPTHLLMSVGRHPGPTMENYREWLDSV